MKKLTVGDIREPVIRLALLQEAKLRKHDKLRGERGWARDLPGSLLARVYDEVRELSLVLPKVIDGQGRILAHVQLENIRSVREECADVSNFIMMINDLLYQAEVENEDYRPGADDIDRGVCTERCDGVSEQSGGESDCESDPGSCEDEGARVETSDTAGTPGEVELEGREKAVALDEVATVRAKKMALSIYTDGHWRDGDLNAVMVRSRVFFECKFRALQAHGWEMDEGLKCWKKRKRRLAIDAVSDLRPQDESFAMMFIEPPVVDLMMRVWRYVEKLLDEEEKKNC